MFQHYNRGKRAVALNLADERGREVLLSMAEEADVFLTSYLPATRRKLGIDVDDVRARNPRIVYAKGTGAGPLGPEAERGGYDAASWWSRGSLSDSAMRVTDTAVPPGMVGHGDGMSGLVFAGGICAALLQRERTGQAVVVDSSLMGTAMWFNAPAIISSTFPAEQQMFNSRPPREALSWSGNTYRTGDDRFLYLSFLGDPQKHWVDLCQRIGRPELADDARFATAADRAAHNTELIGVMDAVFAGRSLDEWRSVLNEALGVWAPVQSAREVHDDPQALANRYVQDVQAGSRTLPLVSPPISFDQEVGDIRRAPDYGEHTDEVLAGLGLGRDEIDELRRAGAVA